MFAIGRYAVTAGCDLDKAGLTVEKNGKFKVNDVEQTNVPHIYAVGDVIYGQMELTPTAIKAGVALAERLYAGKTKKMDYDSIPTTVFTPIEYGTCGLSEEDAIAKYGEDNLNTYHVSYQPLEWQFNKYRPEGEFAY